MLRVAVGIGGWCPMPRVALGASLTPWPGRHGRSGTGADAFSTPTAFSTPRVAVGVSVSTPRVCLRRGALWAAALDRTYADGPDIWPSAYATAVGASRHSCSEWLNNLISSINNPCSWIFRNQMKLVGITTKPKLARAQWNKDETNRQGS
jgi:hypothetical protein